MLGALKKEGKDKTSACVSFICYSEDFVCVCACACACVFPALFSFPQQYMCHGFLLYSLWVLLCFGDLVQWRDEALLFTFPQLEVLYSSISSVGGFSLAMPCGGAGITFSD